MSEAVPHRADGGGGQPADPARRRAGAARGADRADRRRRRIAAHPLLYLGATTRPARGCATRWSRRPARGVEVSLLVDGFGASDAARPSSRRSPRPARASAASCRAGAGAICCATTRSWRSPTAGKVIIGGFNISNDYFGTIEAGRLARPRPPGRGRRASTAWSAISRPCSPGRESPRRVDPRAAAAAQPTQHHATARSTGCSAGRPGGSAPGRARSGTT